MPFDLAANIRDELAKFRLEVVEPLIDNPLRDRMTPACGPRVVFIAMEVQDCSGDLNVVTNGDRFVRLAWVTLEEIIYRNFPSRIAKKVIALNSRRSRHNSSNQFGWRCLKNFTTQQPGMPKFAHTAFLPGFHDIGSPNLETGR